MFSKALVLVINLFFLLSVANLMCFYDLPKIPKPTLSLHFTVPNIVTVFCHLDHFLAYVFMVCAITIIAWPRIIFILPIYIKVLLRRSNYC